MTIRKSQMLVTTIMTSCLVALTSCEQQQMDVASGPDRDNTSAYGFDAPGLEPELFAFDLVGNDHAQLALAMSPDGKELYFTEASIGAQGISFKLKRSSFADNRWTPVAPASFGSEYGDTEAFFDTSGQRLYFFSSRPENETSERAPTMNLWYVEKDTNSWGPPVLLGNPGSVVKYGWSATLLSDDTLYFTARPHENPGLADIYEIPITGDSLGEPKIVSGGINTPEFTENEPAVAPNGNYMVFYSAGRPDNLSTELLGDLYISFRGTDGNWLPAVHMDAPINSAAEENWPRFSPDGKFLFFSSTRRKGTELPDLYWVSTQALQRYNRQ